MDGDAVGGGEVADAVGGRAGDVSSPGAVTVALAPWAARRAASARPGGNGRARVLCPLAATKASTLSSARRRPWPITTRCSAVRAISLIRCDDTSTVRPSAARERSRVRIHKIPSGSSPLMGSSRIKMAGSPRRAEAIPRRCPIPSENPPARLEATAVEPTMSSTASTRRWSMPLARARQLRWFWRCGRDGRLWGRGARRPRTAVGGGRRTAAR